MLLRIQRTEITESPFNSLISRSLSRIAIVNPSFLFAILRLYEVCRPLVGVTIDSYLSIPAMIRTVPSLRRRDSNSSKRDQNRIALVFQRVIQFLLIFFQHVIDFMPFLASSFVTTNSSSTLPSADWFQRVLVKFL